VLLYHVNTLHGTATVINMSLQYCYMVAFTVGGDVKPCSIQSIYSTGTHTRMHTAIVREMSRRWRSIW